jgi:hypothetical protein
MQENFNVENFQTKTSRVYTFGSYNLMIIAKIFMQYEDAATLDNYYGGESIISCMGRLNEKLLDTKVVHQNSFRQTCIVQDFEKRFAHLNPGQFNNIDYIFIDLLDERFDVGKNENNELFTISDYFNDIQTDIDMKYTVIKSFTEEWYGLWEEACDRFVKRIKKYISENKIVLIKTKLSEQYYSQDGVFNFDNLDYIKTVNANLEKCYNILQKKCPMATVIDIEELERYQTSYLFRHGCYPWHLNDALYLKASNFIKKQLYD